MKIMKLLLGALGILAIGVTVGHQIAPKVVITPPTSLTKLSCPECPQCPPPIEVVRFVEKVKIKNHYIYLKTFDR